MTQNERALQILSVLAHAAYNRQLLNYTILSKATGIPRVALVDILPTPKPRQP